MASQGPNNPGTLVNVSESEAFPWTNPGNAAAEDGSIATVAFSQPGITEKLLATNFGFTIPNGATINGILVSIKNSQINGTGLAWSTVCIVKSDGSYGSTNKAYGNLSTSLEYADFGGASDLWGESWSYSDINDADFGVSLAVYVACFYPDALISTPDGGKRIADVNIGDDVLSFDNDRHIIERKVVNKWVVDGQFTFIHFTTKSGKKFICTDNHIVLTDKGFDIAKNIKVGNILYLYTDENVLEDRVIDIHSEIDNTTVYDIEVDGSHTFISDGFLVHNFLPPTYPTAKIDHIRITVYYTEGGSQSVQARPFAVNHGSIIAGTTQSGKLAIGTTARPYGGGMGGVDWYNGPDETNGFIVAKDSGALPTFWRSATKSDADFIAMVNSIRMTQPYYTLVSECTAWLSANGYYTTYE